MHQEQHKQHGQSTYMQTIGDVDQSGENHIGREEGLRQGDATNGGVIQSTLKPLVRVCVGGILCTNKTKKEKIGYKSVNSTQARRLSKGNVSHNVKIFKMVNNLPAAGTSDSARDCRLSRIASGCVYRPSHSIQSDSSQTAPLQTKEKKSRWSYSKQC